MASLTIIPDFVPQPRVAAYRESPDPATLRHLYSASSAASASVMGPSPHSRTEASADDQTTSDGLRPISDSAEGVQSTKAWHLEPDEYQRTEGSRNRRKRPAESEPTATSSTPRSWTSDNITNNMEPPQGGIWDVDLWWQLFGDDSESIGSPEVVDRTQPDD
jgi:hypothetical protein